jgi:hypothetical protein
MKKVVSLVFAMMFLFAVNTWADGECPDCPKTSCNTPRMCQHDQVDCGVAQPCNVVFYVCECGDGYWKDGDYVGVSVTSLTEGVYISGGAIAVKLFAELNDNTDAAADVDDACDYLEAVGDADVPNGWDFQWQLGGPAPATGGVGSLQYFDPDGDELDPPNLGDFDDCELEGDEMVDMVTTCGEDDNAFILDVTDDVLSPAHAIQGDNDDDGVAGEDAGKDYLLVKVPTVAVDWAEVEAAGLKGTIATANVCILDMKDSATGLCTDCTIVCCCTIETVKLCTDQKDKCIYFPYALYGQQDSGWGTGIAISNISLDNPAAQLDQVAVADQVVDVTIIDQTGAVFEATFSDFNYAIEAFNVDDFVDNKLGLTGVAAGNLYIKFEANFDIDGYTFHLLNTGSVSFGAGHLARSCSWPLGHVFIDELGDDIEQALDDFANMGAGTE